MLFVFLAMGCVSVGSLLLGLRVRGDVVRPGAAHKRDRRAHGPGRKSQKHLWADPASGDDSRTVRTRAGHSISSGAGRLLGSQLYGVNPRDPVIVTIATIALALSAFFAAFDFICGGRGGKMMC
jgi:hypothetical protein